MTFRLSTLAVATALAVSACGGGGGGGTMLPILPGPAPAPAPEPPPPAPAPPAPAPAPAPAPEPPPPAARTFLYETLPAATSTSAFLAQLNAQGARGLRLLGGLAFTQSPAGIELVEAYVRDTSASATYTYERQAPPADAAALAAQLEAQGARGFAWVGAYSVGGEISYIYQKQDASTTTFSYRVLPAQSAGADYLAQTNAQGAEGFFGFTPSYLIGGAAVAIYGKASGSAATFAYELLESPTADDAFMATLNSAGGRGFRLRTPYFFTEGARLVMVRDVSQSATFSFFGLAPAGNAAAFVAQANAEGAKGNGYLGDYALPSGAISTLYFDETGCVDSVLCRPSSFLGW